MEVIKLTNKEDFHRGTCYLFSFSYHKITLCEKKYVMKLITLISMYHLKPLVSLQVHLKLKCKCTNCFLYRHFSDPFHKKIYRRFVYFEDTVTYFDKIVMFSHRGKQIDILKFILVNSKHFISFLFALLRIFLH